jgi:hypothetical protein
MVKKKLSHLKKVSYLSMEIRNQFLDSEATSLEYTRLGVSQDILFRYNLPMRNWVVNCERCVDKTIYSKDVACTVYSGKKSQR